MSLHRVRPALAVAGRTEVELPEMAVAVDSRAVGMKSCRSCPATCRSVVVVVVGVTVGDVVFDLVYFDRQA